MGAGSPWTKVGVGLAAVIAVYAPIVPLLAQEWAAFPSLSHGFAVPLISAYLVWMRRRDLAGMNLAPSIVGLPLLVGGLVMYVAGTLAAEPFVSRVSLLVSVSGAILFLAGGPVTRALLPAVGYLALMIPLPYVTMKSLTDQLRVVDATASAMILPALGVPVLQNGFLLHLPNITLEVADVCSSIPAILSLLALGAAFGYITQRPRSVHLVLVLAAVPLGFLSNIVRITLTAAGAYYVGPITLESVLHTWHGTVVFVLTAAALSVLDAGLMRLRLEPR